MGLMLQLWKRFNPLLYFVVLLGWALSGYALSHFHWSWFAFSYSFLGLLILAFDARIGDDQEDWEKDRIAFPKRVPFSQSKLREIQKIMTWVSLGFALLLFFSEYLAGFFFFLCLVLWRRSVLQIKVLGKIPFLLFFLKELSTYLATAYVLALWPIDDPKRLVWFPVLVFGAFFVHALCRKLDPKLHPIQMSQLHYYGLQGVIFEGSAALLLSAIAAGFLGLQGILWPMQVVLFLSLLSLFWDFRRFRLPMLLGHFSLLLHLWVPFLTLN